MIRENPEYLNRYHETLRDLTEGSLADGKYEEKIEQTKQLLSPWIEKDPTAFCTEEEFEKACETLKEFCTCRTESIRRQLAGELSADSNEQERQAMVDASKLNLLNMGALVLGYE